MVTAPTDQSQNAARITPPGAHPDRNELEYWPRTRPLADA
jgi:hypothetical protein